MIPQADPAAKTAEKEAQETKAMPGTAEKNTVPQQNVDKSNPNQPAASGGQREVLTSDMPDELRERVLAAHKI